MEYSVGELKSLLGFHGRVLPTTEAIFFNWTASGFWGVFSGKRLRAKFRVIPGHVEGVEFPFLGITSGGSAELERRIRMEDGEAWYTLYEADAYGTHEIHIWKLTENYRGKCALLALETDGILLEPRVEKKAAHIEFVGDSITCGYGNEASNREDPFRPEEENGYITYAMCASRLLNAEPTCISVSGICVAVDPQSGAPGGVPGMKDLYPFTDAPYEQEYAGKEVPVSWEFAAHPKDAVVINLGTNDVNAFKLAGDRDAAAAFFAQQYMGFLQQIRHLNGAETFILCTLGPLDYYLYDQIRDVVAEYQEETGDQNIACFKYGGVVQWSEGYGAVGHPSAATHRRMGQELATELRRHLKGV